MQCFCVDPCKPIVVHRATATRPRSLNRTHVAIAPAENWVHSIIFLRRGHAGFSAAFVSRATFFFNLYLGNEPFQPDLHF